MRAVSHGWLTGGYREVGVAADLTRDEKELRTHISVVEVAMREIFQAHELLLGV